MSLPNIERLFSVPYWDGKTSFGLETPRALLKALGDPQDKLNVAHVTGTNGKGSVCCYLASIMAQSGKKVGQYSSPHLVDVTERFLIDGRQVSEQLLDQVLGEVFECCDALQLTPSYFELLTAAGFLIFQREGVEFAAIEVGLGGRLDATNCITKPLVSVITSISLDHTHLLGATEQEIAKEKGGIIKSGAPVIVGNVSPAVAEQFRAIAAEKGSELYLYGDEFSLADSSSELVTQFGQSSYQFGLEKLPGYQPRNGAVAARAALLLGASEKEIATGLAAARWPGRLEHFVVKVNDREQDVLLDCAHNPEGVKGLISYLKQLVAQRQFSSVRFIVSILSTKDHQEMLRSLAESSEQLGVKVDFLLTASAHGSAVAPDQLASEIQQGEIVADPVSALEQALAEAGQKQLLVITGSIYLVGALRKVLLERFCEVSNF